MENWEKNVAQFISEETRRNSGARGQPLATGTGPGAISPELKGLAQRGGTNSS